MTYELWYWNGIPGRGEFVRLALEAGGIPYRERAREPGGDVTTLIDDMQSARKHPPFAPPYLVAGKMTLGQTANILLYLGEKHGLAPDSLEGRLWVNQLQLTIGDMVAEAHDTHHPISASEYYEDQMEEAARRPPVFRGARGYLGSPPYPAMRPSVTTQPSDQAATPASARSPTSSIALIAHCSSISEVSPLIPIAPSTAPASLRISTPPGAGTTGL